MSKSTTSMESLARTWSAFRISRGKLHNRLRLTRRLMMSWSHSIRFFSQTSMSNFSKN